MSEEPQGAWNPERYFRDCVTGNPNLRLLLEI